MGNRVIKKLGSDERLFNKREKNLKYKKGNRVDIIHRGDYKRKLDLNLHANPIFDVNPRPGDVILVRIDETNPCGR